MALAFIRYVRALRSPATAKQYETSVKIFLRWLGMQGHSDLEKLPRNILQNYCVFLSERDLAPSTIHIRVSVARQFLGWCRTENVILPNFYPAKPPRLTAKVKGIVPSEVLPYFFKAASTLAEPLQTAILLLPCSGLRCDEMVSLPLHCLKQITLPLKNGERKKALVIIVKGKGGDERLVPLLDEGVKAVMSYLQGWRRKQPDTRWLFPGRAGQHLSDRTLRAALSRLRKPLKLNFTPHTMRRTYLTTLYHQGVEVTILTKIAGHKNPRTLIDHYLYLDPQDLAGAVQGKRLMEDDSGEKD